MDRQVEQNIARRVAIAAGIIAATAIGVVGREEIGRQITRAIEKLPDFYEALANSPYSWLGLARTESFETAEDLFVRLTARGSKRFTVDPKFISFMAPQHNIILDAVAASSRIGGIFVTMSREEDARKPLRQRSELRYIRLTSRRLDFPVSNREP